MEVSAEATGTHEATDQNQTTGNPNQTNEKQGEIHDNATSNQTTEQQAGVGDKAKAKRKKTKPFPIIGYSKKELENNYIFNFREPSIMIFCFK